MLLAKDCANGVCYLRTKALLSCAYRQVQRRIESGAASWILRRTSIFQTRFACSAAIKAAEHEGKRDAAQARVAALVAVARYHGVDLDRG